MKATQWIFAIIFASLLVQLKLILGDSVPAKVLPNVIILAGIARFALFQKGKFYAGRLEAKPTFYAILLFHFFIIGSVMRTNHPLPSAIAKVNVGMQILLAFYFVYLAITYFYRESEDFAATTREILLFLLTVPCFILLLNVLTLVLDIPIGVKPPLPPEAIGAKRFLLSLVGIDSEPSGFPLAGYGHPNSVGIYAGAMFAMNGAALVYLKMQYRYKQLILINIGVCAIAMILADSRGTILNALITLIVVFLLHRFRRLGLLRAAVLIVPALPFLLMFTLKSLANHPTFSQLGRDENDLKTGNSRGIVWDACIEEFEVIKTKHLFGYGEFGAHGSGTYNKWKRKFGEITPEREMGVSVTHNAFFQSLFDIGIFGTVSFLLALLAAMRGAIRLYQHGMVEGLVLIHFCLYFILSGMSESSIGEYNHVYNMIFIVMTAAIVSLRNEQIKYALAQHEKALTAA